MAIGKSPIQQINNKLIDLWVGNSFTKLVPMFYPEPSPDSILFVGINPSFNAKAIMHDLKGKPEEFLSIEEINEFYTFNLSTVEERISKLQVIQKRHREFLPYFKKHRQLSEKLDNHSWEQIDLFQVRESIQTKLLNDYNSAERFFSQQLDIFFELLNIFNPKAIIVLNRSSSDILKKYFLKRDSSFLPKNKEMNQYELKLKEITIPVMFSIHTQYKKKDEREKIEKTIIDFVESIRS